MATFLWSSKSLLVQSKGCREGIKTKESHMESHSQSHIIFNPLTQCISIFMSFCKVAIFGDDVPKLGINDANRGWKNIWNYVLDLFYFLERRFEGPVFKLFLKAPLGIYLNFFLIFFFLQGKFRDFVLHSLFSWGYTWGSSLKLCFGHFDL